MADRLAGSTASGLLLLVRAGGLLAGVEMQALK
jgi:hypothetical protein